MNIPTRPIPSLKTGNTVLPADWLSYKLALAGVTRDRAKAVYERLFARYGRFPRNRQRMVFMDALYILTVWGRA